jgi:hypothetical protein
MRGKAILFPPHDGFTYWNPPEHIKRQLSWGNGRIGQKVALSKRAVCRMCGKTLPAGSQAIVDYCTYDHMRYGIEGFIHPEKCIPLITAILGNRVDGVFVEGARVSTDDTLFTEGFNAHNLEEALEEAGFLLDSYWNGVWELCYIEVDGQRHPEPLYSQMYKHTTIKR